MIDPHQSILIFDDDDDIVFLCTLLLENMGWQVHAQSTANNILEVVKEFKPSAILMDNWIPDTGGIAATQVIKSCPELQSIPVIFFTANNNIKKLCEQAGANFYLSKPFDVDEFKNLFDSVSSRI